MLVDWWYAVGLLHSYSQLITFVWYDSLYCKYRHMHAITWIISNQCTKTALFYWLRLLRNSSILYFACFILNWLITNHDVLSEEDVHVPAVIVSLHTWSPRGGNWWQSDSSLLFATASICPMMSHFLMSTSNLHFAKTCNDIVMPSRHLDLTSA